MSSKKDKILQFVKKHKDELKANIDIGDFSGIIEELFNEFTPNMDQQEKINLIVESISGDDEQGELIEGGDYQSYFERLVKFVEDDPLEKNNLKSGSSGSSDEDDVKPNKKRQRSRDKEKKNDKKSKKSSSQKPITIANFLQMNVQELSKVGKNQRFGEILQQLLNRPQQQQPRKDMVFIHNLPKDSRSYSEIEAIFANKGPIAKIQLGGRVPCVHFKRPQDAQNVLENIKFIVHKGIKIEFKQLLVQHNREDEEIPLKKQSKDLKKEEPKQEQQMIVEEPKKFPREEQDLATQLDTLKSQVNGQIADRIRLILLLSKRSANYAPELNQEIDELKQKLKQKKDEVSKATTLDQLKQEITWLNTIYDHTVAVQLPESLFQRKAGQPSINQVLNDQFSTFGKIDNLILKIKERKALIKFMNFESAEKAFQTQGQYTVDFVNQDIKKLIIT
ncbi:hypothetical protein pb186bvf_003376 [Paramecium bursaria]